MSKKQTNGKIKRRPLRKGEGFSCTNVFTSIADIRRELEDNCTKILNYVESKMIEGTYTVIKAFPNAVIKNASTVLKRVIRSFSKEKGTFRGNQLTLIIAMQKTHSNHKSKDREPTKIEQSDNGRTE